MLWQPLLAGWYIEVRPSPALTAGAREGFWKKGSERTVGYARESIEREQLEQRLRVMKRLRVRVSIFQGKGRVGVAEVRSWLRAR